MVSNRLLSHNSEHSFYATATDFNLDWMSLGLPCDKATSLDLYMSHCPPVKASKRAYFHAGYRRTHCMVAVHRYFWRLARVTSSSQSRAAHLMRTRSCIGKAGAREHLARTSGQKHDIPAYVHTGVRLASIPKDSTGAAFI